MRGRLEQPEHWGHASIGSLEQLYPLIARARKEDVCQPAFERGPLRAIPLRQLLGGELQPPEQLGVELRLERPDRHVAAIGRLVDLVEVRAGVEHVGPDRKSTRLNSSHRCISYAVFCLKKK